MIGKDKLVFDTSDAEAIQASDAIGSFTRAGDSGALISSHSSQEAGTISFTFVDGDVTTGTDSIAETAHGLQTGDKVQLSNAGGALPTGLSAATDYYVIRESANAFKLAASPADAQLGNAIDITAAAGGGTHTLTEQDSERRSLDVYFTNASLPISATDLDIRDLVFATDKVDVSGSSNVAVVDGGGSLTVDASQLDIDDLNATDDAVAAWLADGSGNAISSTGGALDVNIANASIAVTATDLDIRDLDFATDSVDVSGSSVSISGTVAVTQSTSPWVIGDGGGSITVDASQLDIDDLNATDDAVAAWLADGAGNAITSSGGALDINIASSDIEIDVEDDKANIALENTAKSVTTSSAALLASQLADRRFMWVQNLGNKAIFVGKSGVSTSNGLRLSPGSVLEIRLGPAVSMHAVAQNGSQDTRIMEAS